MSTNAISPSLAPVVNCYHLPLRNAGKRRIHLEKSNKEEKIARGDGPGKTIQISIDDSSGIPIWLQLKNRIVYLILSGQFEPDERLPTVRELAVELGVNYNTVMKVYQDIERDGYVDPDDVVMDMARSLADEFIRQCRELGMPRNDIVELVNARLDRSE